MYDVVVIGMGPAGLNAGLYAKRSGLKTLMIEKSAPGGKVNYTNVVNNYLGFDSISGSDLAQQMFSHVIKEEVPYIIEEVKDIIVTSDKKTVITNKQTIDCKTIIICGGKVNKKLEAKGEKQNNISYCAVCDAPLYKNKTVAVIGAGNSAFEEGSYLSSFVKHEYILVRSSIKADKVLIDEVKSKKNIEILYDAVLDTMNYEEDVLKSITLTNKKTIDVDGIFVYIGSSPLAEYTSKINITNEQGFIEVDKNQETRVKGIYAAGDIIKKDLYQIINAASEGAVAANEARKYINSLKEEI
ncbi:MAG: FAD-dependent oxidoreductase [Bacilli bacterium]